MNQRAQKNAAYFIGLVFFVLVFLVVINIKKGFIPDLLGLGSISNSDIQSYFQWICQITASIFAILLAVITFGLDLLGKGSRRRNRSLMNRPLVQVAISFGVALILISIYAALSIHSFNSSGQLTVAYIIGIMFVVFVIGLFPFTTYIIKNADTVYEVKQRINKYSGEGSLDPFVSNELVHYITDFDRDAYKEYLLLPLIKKIHLLVENNANAPDLQQSRLRIYQLFQEVGNVWKVGVNESERVNDQEFLRTILANAKELYYLGAKQKIGAAYYQGLKDFLDSYIVHLIDRKDVDGLIYFSRFFSDTFLYLLANHCPTEQKISPFYLGDTEDYFTKGEDVSDEQWNHINHFIEKVTSLFYVAINLASKRLLDDIMFNVKNILFRLRFDKNIMIGIKQEANIIEHIHFYQTHYAIKALEIGLYKSSFGDFDFRGYMREYIVEGKIFVSKLLNYMKDYVTSAQRCGRLSVHTIEELGGLARMLTGKDFRNNSMVMNSISFIVELFDKIRGDLTKNLGDDLANTNYEQVKKEIESIRTFLNKGEKSMTRGIRTKISRILKKF